MRTLFVALLLGEARGRALSCGADPFLSGNGYRRPRPEGLHLTLFYAGKTPAERADALASGLASSCSTWRAPRLRLDHVGAFPRPGHERVLWVGCHEEQPGALAALHAGVVGLAAAAGCDVSQERSRPFRPHVTIARPRVPGAVPATLYEWKPELPWEPDEVHLVESVPAEGPRLYRSIGRWPLAPETEIRG